MVLGHTLHSVITTDGAGGILCGHTWCQVSNLGWPHARQVPCAVLLLRPNDVFLRGQVSTSGTEEQLHATGSNAYNQW